MALLGSHCKSIIVSFYTSIADYKVAIILGLCHSINSLPRRNLESPIILSEFCSVSESVPEVQENQSMELLALPLALFSQTN